MPTYTITGDTHKLCRRQKWGELLLHRFNKRKDEESNHQLSLGAECDKDHLQQMDTPASITSMMSCQTLINNAKVKWMDEANKLDPQDGWGKAVSFITNQSSKLHLSNVFTSWAHIPVVTKRGKLESNITEKGKDSKNETCILETMSDFTFFL